MTTAITPADLAGLVRSKIEPLPKVERRTFLSNWHTEVVAKRQDATLELRTQRDEHAAKNAQALVDGKSLAPEPEAWKALEAEIAAQKALQDAIWAAQRECAADPQTNQEALTKAHQIANGAKFVAWEKQLDALRPLAALLRGWTHGDAPRLIAQKLWEAIREAGYPGRDNADFSHAIGELRGSCSHETWQHINQIEPRWFVPPEQIERLFFERPAESMESKRSRILAGLKALSPDDRQRVLDATSGSEPQSTAAPARPS